MTYTLPSRLTVHDVAAIARGAAVRVSGPARAEIENYYHQANRIAEEQPVYGRSTGVGANRSSAASSDPVAHGMNLLRSHAVDAGPPFDSETTRAMLVVRLNQLLHPGSGIDPVLIDGLERMLVSGSLPEVRRYGGIGTADLSALAGTALALVGERPTSGEGFEPIGPIRADSALPFMSSSALTLGGAALACARLAALADAGIAAFAFSAAAARANASAFSAEAALAVGSPTAARTASRLAGVLGEQAWDAVRIQDPFAYRGFLPAMSVLTSATQRLGESIETLVSSSQENPRFFAEQGIAVHHGAFLENWLAHELDATAIALAQTASLVLGRLRFINDDAFSGLPRFLAPEPGASSGTMIVEYVSASAMGEVLAAAAPVSTHSAVLSCGIEDDATFAPTALSKLQRALDGYEIMVACEIVVAVRALRLQGAATTGVSAALVRLLEIADELPDDLGDRDLREDLEIAARLIGRIADAVDASEAPAPGAH
ncbi:aromatic amino acid lyase [Leucobacter sp. wl10]|uniref:aromatic amino acid lyase n=1 Tax=Leucobacter sp. wl10 TaxID=2304677 RepID=UPI000E5B6F8E|nr:aromatic amino acid lyase [Leucobacter sp. wl10]RGE19492.1 histidine ammonia-lyase [Leucobacter sp. wl10]